VRFVLDVNVFVSGLLSRAGAPARLLERWLDGDFELIASEQLLGELERTLAAPKLRKRIAADEAAELVTLIRDLAELTADPSAPPAIRSEDHGDDYLIALAETARAHLVSGDAHLLTLEGAIPVLAPRAALDLLG
jgi:putative PIN family toxin of toxin-antitoxin system